MFGSLGWGEVLVLVIAALFIFGPDKLPHAAKQASQGLKSVRELLTGARKQFKTEFGDVTGKIDPSMLNPKEFVRRQLWEDLDDEPSDAPAATAPTQPHRPTAGPVQFDAEAT